MKKKVGRQTQMSIQAKGKPVYLNYSAGQVFMSKMWLDQTRKINMYLKFSSIFHKITNLLTKMLKPESYHLVKRKHVILFLTQRDFRSLQISVTELHCILIETSYLIPFVYWGSNYNKVKNVSNMYLAIMRITLIIV